MSLTPFLQRVASREHLSAADAYQAMSVVLDGAATEPLLAAFLVALKMKGETAAELAGFARAMRERSIYVDCGPDVIDTCGTGGSGDGTFNISTVAAIVMAGAGARVAKHGNRSISSASAGSAEVVEALGVRFAMSPEDAARAVREVGIGFLYAPHLHPAMKHAQPVRRQLKMRTVFNLLGPLANPAHAQSQLIGAPSAQAARLMAEALAELGTRRSFVVHGYNGLDEISTTGATEVFEVCGGAVDRHVWSPADFGIHGATLEELRGGDAACNARIALEVLEGREGPARDIVVVNAAAGLVAAGIARDLRAGVTLAQDSIDTGAARARLDALQEKFPAI
ncbi:MAG: anthranilate phosphoribosyltransferase [Acidobacteriia bacterium]|nr:anthranilate phosphoribosyltransferase [Terriglobia bacterium]